MSNIKAASLLKNADLLLFSLSKQKNIFLYNSWENYKIILGLGKPIVGMINGEANRLINNNNLGLACKASDFKSLARNIIKIKKMKNKKKKNCFQLIV